MKRNEKNNFLFLPRIVYAKLFSTGKFLNETSQFNTYDFIEYILNM